MTVTLTIPAEYTDDFRAAVVAEIQSDTEWVAVQQSELLDARSGERQEICAADLSGAFEVLVKDVGVLQQMANLDATGPLEISADAETLWGFLERAGRLWTAQLTKAYDYGPADIKTAMVLLKRLQWAAGTSAILFPAEVA